MEAIILAGGMGTRLRDTVPGLPKCMAPVNNRPFISYVTDYLSRQGVNRFIFSLGYGSHAFTGYLAATFPAKNYELVIEPEPLGTGGAIRLACRHARSKRVVAVNGDSLCLADLAKQVAFHESVHADCTLALVPMINFDRYGIVKINDDQSIASFEEKKFSAGGLINGGVYVLNTASFIAETLPDKFSFENDYLQALHKSRKFYGLVQDAYFIDIGVPADYLRAQTELL